MSRRSMRVAMAVVVLGALVPAAIKAIYVSPTAVFIDHEDRAGQVTLGNSGETPEEVTVALKFGFPDTDSAGTPFIRFIEAPGSQFPSAEEWIRPFPRRVRLEPGEQQVVRLLAEPPDDLPDGEYWSRMIVTARGATVPMATGDTAVRAGLNLEIRLVTSVTYRKGEVTTGVALRELTAEAGGDSLVVWASMVREGNAAYLGTATFEVLGSDATPVREWSTVLAVYYPMNRRFSFPLDGLGPGTYLVRLRLEAQRADMLEGQVLEAPAVSDSVSFAVP